MSLTFDEFNDYMLQYCIEKNLMIKEICDVDFLKEKTNNMLSEADQLVQNTEVINISCWEFILNKEQPRSILFKKLLFNIINLWIPSYRCFTEENKRVVSAEIYDKLSKTSFQNLI
jgi:hypothetical protein